MTTTLVRDSIVGDDWILRTMQAVPIQRIVDPATGQPTGDILTGPVRLAFDTLFDLPAATEDNKNPKYGATLLFPPNVDMALLYEEYYKICAQKFAQQYDAASGSYSGLHVPFHMQDEKLKFGGFTPGCVSINVTSQYQPPVTDSRHNPIVDKTRVYPGVWAICAINAYDFNNPKKKGVSFGLQNVMIIGDDTKFGGGAKASKDQFSGIQVDAPIARPDPAQMLAPAAPAPAVAIPGYTAPGGGVSPLAQPAVAGAPIATPPVAAPAQPYVPPATTSPTEYDFMK